MPKWQTFEYVLLWSKSSPNCRTASNPSLTRLIGLIWTQQKMAGGNNDMYLNFNWHLIRCVTQQSNPLNDQVIVAIIFHNLTWLQTDVVEVNLFFFFFQKIQSVCSADFKNRLGCWRLYQFFFSARIRKQFSWELCVCFLVPIDTATNHYFNIIELCDISSFVGSITNNTNGTLVTAIIRL